MSDLPFSDREVERVLAGQQPHGRPDLADVAYFVARLRALGDFERPPPIGPALRAQLERAQLERGELETAEAQQIGPNGRRYATTYGYEDTGHDEGADLVHLDGRRRANRRTGRVRWRLVGAAAAVVMVLGVGSALVIGLQGMRQSPEVETETVVDSADDSVPSTEEPAPKATEPSTTSTEAVPADEDEDTEGSQVPAQPGQAPDEATNEAPTDRSSPEPPPPDDESDQIPDWMIEDWPEECPEGDLQCAWDHYRPYGSGRDRPGSGNDSDP